MTSQFALLLLLMLLSSLVTCFATHTIHFLLKMISFCHWLSCSALKLRPLNIFFFSYLNVYRFYFIFFTCYCNKIVLKYFNTFKKNDTKTLIEKSYIFREKVNVLLKTFQFVE